MEPSKRVTPAVAGAIKDMEQRSEILISWIQLGFVVFIGVLYFLAPKGHQGTVPIRPVPFALAVYAPFVLIRLLLALKRRLTPPILYLSIVFDVAVISALLWAYHIQYQQPPGFYLKAPTAMYLFVFIALRSLRFSPRYVAVTGAAAAVAWVGLTAYAIAAGSGVTGDFITYITSTEVLIGAQVDRIVALVALTVVLALAVHRGSELLISSATERNARAELSRYFSPDVISRILDAEVGFQPGQGQVRTAATMMVDLRGFSSWADAIDPAAVMTTLAEYQARAVPVILGHRGSVDKFMGDGILCHFGAAEDTDSFARDAMQCAEALFVELSRWRDERRAGGQKGFEFAVGLSGGRLVFGAVGDRDRLEFTVVGAPVNTAAKLEKHAKRLGAAILATDDIYNAAVQSGYTPGLPYRKATAQAVEGLRQPIDLAAVILTDVTGTVGGGG